MITTATTTPAQLIEQLRSYFNEGSDTFSFKCTMFIAGDYNKEIRRQIIKIITCEDRPLSKCGLTATEQALTNYFNSPQLF